MKCDNYKCRVSKGKVVRGVLELVGTPGVIPTQCVTMTVCPGAPMPSPCGSAAPSTPTAPPDYAANQPFIPQMIAAVVAEAKAVERE